MTEPLSRSRVLPAGSTQDPLRPADPLTSSAAASGRRCCEGRRLGGELTTGGANSCESAAGAGEAGSGAGGAGELSLTTGRAETEEPLQLSGKGIAVSENTATVASVSAMRFLHSQKCFRGAFLSTNELFCQPKGTASGHN